MSTKKSKKLSVGVLFGGRSGEHEVSLQSAASILKAIDREKFDVSPIGITKDGRWLTGSEALALIEGEKPAAATKSNGVLNLAAGLAALNGIDVVFPVLHGTFGEDGTIQGLFELAGVAYVGSGVLGSSAGMDKDAMKRMFAQVKLPLVKHVTVLRAEFEKSPRKVVTKIEAALKYPVFVKPANLGSSVGISKVHDHKELSPALKLAAKYDRKLVIEQGVGGKKSRARELEVAVLGNDASVASVIGEIVPGKEFYDYEAKYLSEASVPTIPAKLTKAEAKQIREMAVEAFRACDLAGMARVDFLMEPDGRKRIYLNEVNTLPGFTRISMYPKLWDATGITYRSLITKLIELAAERHADKARTVYSREE
ncbi:D-alanine--D-alanine ligase family protein [Telmatobacter bradus]|uniref:D-alanine--D-alanine ligase family protein n=1 Tax=Telmatobacter bradus TaxID=474953 RepID=UPI003B42AC6A